MSVKEFNMPQCLSDLLQRSSSRHSHLCPRQVLGVRMGLAGLAALGLTSPVTKTTAMIILETDGCFADGIEVATGAMIGHRTLRVNDLGKIAATFVDVKSAKAIRVSPALDARARAQAFESEEDRHYFAQVSGYKDMPDAQLLRFEEVVLDPPLEVLLARPNVRVICAVCGEEIINERQVQVDGLLVCRSCADQGYYFLKPLPVGICAIMNDRSE
jgi:formylmethanofuran dehydrogenase subunit E